jgi:3-hydroxyacyl-CoA dehydrogenase
LPVYAKQLFPEGVLGEPVAVAAKTGTTVFETDALRMWTHPSQPSIAIASIKTKMHSLGTGVLEGLLKAVDEAEANYAGLVIWQEAPFAVGADLTGALAALKAGQFEQFEAMVAQFQHCSQRLKYSAVPVVAAVDGLALGGGAEFVMHANRRVATLESYVGLVEAGVGLLPAGGGLKEFARRIAQDTARLGYTDSFPMLSKIFKQIAMGEVGKSGLEAFERNFYREGDVIVFNNGELLSTALTVAMSMADTGYRAELPSPFPVAGYTGKATLKMMLINMKAGGFISEHDYLIGECIADCLCGGDVDPGSMVNDDWIIALERKHFVALAKTAKSQDRIEYMLKNGKPLRN